MITYHELHQQLYNSLTELGLTENEMKLYTLSLFHGPRPVAQLAQLMGIPRPNIYKLIVGLEAYGLAHFSHRKRYTRTFVVEPPSALLEQLRKKREQIVKLDQTVTMLMPDLYALYHQGETPTKIQILSGAHQYEKAIREMFDEVKDELYFFGSVSHFIDSVSPQVFSRLTERRIERQICLKAMMVDEPHVQELIQRAKEELREVKLLPQDKQCITSFQLSAHTALIWQPAAPLAVRIQDEYIVAMLKLLFEQVWSSTP
ncbi:MAG: hypothetical protein HYV32_01980 [Candidatus Kerfeldbacteria bacterium]|nr:hypothetical protein [Candidatus Kerfeldbacteria bacterium]